VYAVSRVDAYDRQRNVNAGRLAYFVTHLCNQADLSSHRRGYGLDDFVQYMRTTGQPRLPSPGSSAAVRITLPAESGAIRPGQPINVTGRRLGASTYFVTRAGESLDAVWDDVGSLQGDLAHLTSGGTLVIEGNSGETYRIGPNG
jgi:hypothetical protein